VVSILYRPRLETPSEREVRFGFCIRQTQGGERDSYLFSACCGQKSKHPRPEYDKRNPAHGYHRESNVDEDFAEIIRISGSAEEPILDQTPSFPHMKRVLQYDAGHQLEKQPELSARIPREAGILQSGALVTLYLAVTVEKEKVRRSQPTESRLVSDEGLAGLLLGVFTSLR
jgi:hypothetical protein